MRRMVLWSAVLLPWTTMGEAEDPAWCNQFRGPGRDGAFTARGLLAEWPDGGPSLLWQRAGIGQGYSSPIVTPEGIFVTGELVWQSPPLRFLRTQAFGGKLVDPPVEDADKAGYASPTLLRVGKRSLLAAASARHFVLGVR